MRKLILAFGLSAAVLLAAPPTKRLGEAKEVISELMGAPDKGIPQDLLDKAHCIVVVPGLKKGAIGIGGQYGRGFVNCRAKSGSGWGSPAAVRIEGGSVGLQLGGSSTDVVMLIMNQKGMDRLLSSKFTIGADAAAAAGPVGRSASAATDAMMSAEILSWSRSRGVFAGISLEGSTLRQDEDENKELYGKKITNREIVEQNPAVPAAAQDFVATLNRYSMHEEGAPAKSDADRKKK